jgi:hypothetical protein
MTTAQQSKRVTLSFALIISLAASGCGDARVAKVEKGVAFAKRLLEKTKTHFPTAVSYNSIVETGGSPVSFLAANAMEPKALPQFIWEGPAAPFSVVLRNGSVAGEIIIEGYKDTADKPALTETVKGCGSGEKRKD